MWAEVALLSLKQRGLILPSQDRSTDTAETVAYNTSRQGCVRVLKSINLEESSSRMAFHYIPRQLNLTALVNIQEVL